MRTLIVFALLVNSAFCQTGHGSLKGHGNQKKRPHSHVLLSITVTPTETTINVGSDTGFLATANFSDNTTQDVTGSASWLSLATGVATIGTSPHDPQSVHCLGAGSASIVATYNGFSSQGTITCTPQGPPALVSIAVTPGNPTIYNGQSIGFTATGTYSDGSHQNITSAVNWTSGTPSVGTVGPLTATESGNCLTTGATAITATDLATGIFGTTTLNCTPVPVTLVSIRVTPANTTIYIGTAQNFTATGTYSDGSTKNLTASVAWSSSDNTIATVGPVTTTEPGNCIAAGTVTITATLGVAGNTNLTCTPQVTTPTLVSIKLNPQNPTGFDGSSDTFTATCTYSDNSTRVCTGSDPLTSTATVWASATPSVASLGALTTVQTVNCLTTGSSLISATIGAISGSTTQNCTPQPVTLVSIQVTPGNPTQYNGSSVSFTATGTYSDFSQQNLTSSASWTSGTPAVATISANVATCVANSSTSLITATFSAISGSTTLTCAPVPPSPTGENAGCSIGDVASAPFNTMEITTVLGVTISVAYPHTCLYTATDGTPAPGSLVSKSCPGSQATFQSDLNGLTTGQTLQYPNGCTITITSPLTFPAVSGANITHWNWFESTGGGGFPAEHTRSSPCILGLSTMAFYPTYPCPSPADLTVHIVCAIANGDCLKYATGAAFWRNIGIDVHLSSTATNNGNGLVDLNGADHIIWDRYLGHGNALNCTIVGKAYSCASTDLKNLFSLDNATNIGIINGWGYDVLCPQGNCTDAHVVGGGNGTAASHNFKIYGNLLAAAGEDWLMGGGGGIGSSIVTPTDWDIRNNHFFRPVSWVLRGDGTGQHPEIKNHFEVKNAQRIWFSGNVIENNWMGWQTDQQGYGLVIGPRNQSNTITVAGVTSDGAGNLVATSGSFGTGATSPVSSGCGTPNHCNVNILVNGVATTYKAQTQTNATHISVSPSPPAGTFTNVTQCTTGLNPNATGTDYIIEYNDFRNLTNGVEIASVASDCGDTSLQNTRGSVQWNLFQGISALNNSGLGTNAITRCVPVLNTESVVTITNIARNHNTCIISNGIAFGNSGVDVTYDSNATTSTGSTGAYLANMITANNIGPAGGVFSYKAGGLYPGGAAAGLKQMSCTPPVTGSTCTYSYAANVLGQGLWTSQLFNAPFPSTNQTCNSSGATCFPSGAAFTGLFTQYNSGSGQPGYLGDYHLAGSTYKLSGTDGLNIGADITQVQNMTSGVWSPTTYTAAVITQASPLPGGAVGTPYSLCLAATSASGFQYWTVASGSVPGGLSLSLAGCLTGTPTTAGSFSFGLTMMDAAQQYASKAFTMTVTGGGGGGPNWVLVSTPVGATTIDGFDIRQSNNEWYIADRIAGHYYKSTNQGASWTDITSNIPTGSGISALSIQVNPNDGSLIAGGGNTVKFWRSTNDGSSWTQLVVTNFAANPIDGITGCAMPLSGGGNLVCGGYFSTANHNTFSSTDNGVTGTLTTSYTPLPGGSVPGGYTSGITDPFDGSIWTGSEAAGLWKSTNGGVAFTQVMACISGCAGGTNGNIYGLTFTSGGKPVVSAQGGVYLGTGSGFGYSFAKTFSAGNQGRGMLRDSLGSIYWGHNGISGSRPTYRSTDNGQTFQVWDTGLPTGLDSNHYVENQTDGKIYAVFFNDATNAGSIYRSPK